MNSKRAKKMNRPVQRFLRRGTITVIIIGISFIAMLRLIALIVFLIRRRKPKERPLRYAKLYHDVYTGNETATYDTYLIMEDQALSNTYSIEECEITVVFLDPNLADKSHRSAFYALESVAISLPNACVVLLTSECVYHSTARPRIYKNAFPLFRQMMDQGQVRLKFVDHQHYQLKSCSDFSNPSVALMNVDFWKNEFIEKVAWAVDGTCI